MSLIGTLEKFSVSDVLQRVEVFSKTGLFVVKRGSHWVEFYFRDGRLMCVGPVHANTTFGERLLQARVISTRALQETIQAIGFAEASEMRMALTLMDLGYVGQEELRIWASNKASEALQIILAWSTGEIYFEEDVAPPADRLLVALSVSTLLISLSTSAVPFASVVQTHSAPKSTQPIAPQHIVQAIQTTYTTTQEQVEKQPHPTHVANAPTLLETSQFFPEQLSVESLIPNEIFAPIMNNIHALNAEVVSTPLSPLPSVAQSFLFPSMQTTPATQSTPASAPVRIIPGPIDISFMQPDMLLVPANMTTLCEQNPQIQLTPDHWRILTRVDGRTSLQIACQELLMAPEQLCRVAGELVGVGLIRVAHPAESGIQEYAVPARESISTGTNPAIGVSGPLAASLSPWSRPLPIMPDVLPQHSPVLSFETQSQWGNGGNGAPFVPSQGWVAPVQTGQPWQPLPSSGPINAQAVTSYATIGGSY